MQPKQPSPAEQSFRVCSRSGPGSRAVISNTRPQRPSRPNFERTAETALWRFRVNQRSPDGPAQPSSHFEFAAEAAQPAKASRAVISNVQPHGPANQIPNVQRSRPLTMPNDSAQPGNGPAQPSSHFECAAETAQPAQASRAVISNVQPQRPSQPNFERAAEGPRCGEPYYILMMF